MHLVLQCKRRFVETTAFAEIPGQLRVGSFLCSVFCSALLCRQLNTQRHHRCEINTINGAERPGVVFRPSRDNRFFGCLYLIGNKSWKWKKKHVELK
ncbi:hypothetical protein CDAR_382501 [Caerostris darwini]|uniref:Uncharacterized protein n=1 Tax=Caerostris darwini TaxID=1538125 RepID=A0AAV4SNP4_9ARAC|nr:hypothetical protein CDAR_382501 [Caerostris darwini]